MQDDIKKIKSWSRVQLHAKVIEESKKQGITDDNGEYVTSIGELNEIFALTSSVAMGEKIWQCFYGVFDRDDHWDLKLENDFMTHRQWAYRERANSSTDIKFHSMRNKGCVASIIHSVKNQMVDTLNKGTTNTHNYKIGITRPKSAVKTNPHWRRPLGIFLPYFYHNTDGEAVLDSNDNKECNNDYHKKRKSKCNEVSSPNSNDGKTKRELELERTIKKVSFYCILLI
jgi:hypothetical protein